MTSANSPQVEEGDSRFLAIEVLHEVTACSVLGLVVVQFELVTKSIDPSLYLHFFSLASM